MKYPFLKSALVFGLAAFFGCSDDSTVDVPDSVSPAPLSSAGLGIGSEATVTIKEPCWQLDADQTYLINTSMVVTNAYGSIVGIYDEATKSILSADGKVLIANVDLDGLKVLTPGESIVAIFPSSSASKPMSSAALPGLSSAAVPSPVSSSAVLPASSSGVVLVSSSSAVLSSSSKQEIVTDGKVTIAGNLTQTVAQNASTGEVKFSGLSYEPTRLSWNAYFLETSFSNGTYTIKATTVPEYFELGEVTEFFKVEGKDYELKITVTAKSGNGNQQPVQQSSSSQQQQQPKSSSSQQQQQPKSSSSQQQQQQSSSSQQQQQPKSSSSSAQVSSSSYSYGNTAPGGDIKYVPGGESGSGFATRYWDCCKPSCAWPGKPGIKAHACDASGNKISDDNATSMCDGGNAGTCVNQIPMIVNDNLAYAFAAVPSANGGKCGKCFALEFTGTGKYETKANHKALKGKTLIVMASNVGDDVAPGQFDIMIPGGGFGIFDGCSAKMGWGPQGERYGGLLSECEKEVGYSGDLLKKRKDCLAKKCESSFSRDPVAKEGCMFLATWYEAAGNPNHNYKEVECPSALSSKY